MAISTIVRVACLLLALVNQGLVSMGLSPIPVENEELEMIISTVITAIFAIWAMWKNNSFTAAAKASDRCLEALRDGTITAEELDELIAATRAQE